MPPQAKECQGHRELEEARKGPLPKAFRRSVGTSSALQWLRICLAMQGMHVQSPFRQQRLQHAVEQLSLSITTTEPAPQLEIPASP